MKNQYVAWNSNQYDDSTNIIYIGALDVDKIVTALTGWEYDNSYVLGHFENFTALTNNAVEALGYIVNPMNFYDLPENWDWGKSVSAEQLVTSRVVQWRFARTIIIEDWKARPQGLDTWCQTVIVAWENL